MANLMVFSGNGNPELAQEIARYLGLPIGNALVSQFSDGEINIEIRENVRGRDVFIIQPTCAPTHKNLMELLLMVDALRRPRRAASPRCCRTSATGARTGGCARRGCRSAPAWSPT